MISRLTKVEYAVEQQRALCETTSIPGELFESIHDNLEPYVSVVIGAMRFKSDSMWQWYAKFEEDLCDLGYPSR